MIQTRTLAHRITLVATLACLPCMAQAATSVSDTFDADIGTWVANTSETLVSFSATGGNPGGYLETTSTSGNAFGAQNTAPDYSGVFADGLWTVSVDLIFDDSSYSDARLRFRYQDATSNGWHISLEKGNFPSIWTSYSVTFDTTWDDATAIANGWRKEQDGATPTPHFAELFNNVYNSEIRLVSQPGAVAGIDNYSATFVPVPAAVWLFGSGLLGLIGVARRRKTHS